MPSPGATPFVLLGMLRAAPMSGYALRREIAAAAGTFWSESYGQIYPALRLLARRGWARRRVVRSGRRGGGGPARHAYEITPKGEEAFGRWLAAPPRAAPPREELLLKLFFGSRDAVDAPASWVRRLLADESERLRHVRRMMETIPRSAHGHRSLRHWMMALEHVEAHALASVGWCQRTIATLDLMQEAAARRRTARQRRSPME